MPQESLYELYYEAMAFNNAILEIWITVTFATILSIYISSPHITRFLRLLIAGLYSVSSIVLIGRLFIAVIQAQYFRDLTVSEGYEEIPGNFIVSIVGPLYALLLPIGTVATLYFAASFKRSEPPTIVDNSSNRDGDT